ncbi:MAG TPA: TIGR04290 family methyltransferase [Candidatus Saccharimonadales bacterium]|nr:TIGR04290 family methyltransferase [Candidatus Saccharimonadales bacterium]
MPPLQSFSSTQPPATPDALAQQISELGDWFHNIDLHGIHTAPNHFLGDFPNIKWRHISQSIPQDLTGATVLDVGCNGGFYSLQMKQRGAKRVLGIDICDRYLEQARFASRTLGLEIELEKRSVYEVEAIAGKFDFVIFMGVLYHLRYPLYALDKVVTKVGGKLVFQTMIRGSEEVKPWENNYDFWRKDIFSDPSWPQMYFVEQSYSNDQTNWWIPNRAAAEAMLRSSGLDIESRPESETWICTPNQRSREEQFVHHMELNGSL